ncbi:MAG TPA: fluoride efflux transporter CrcB [Chloroflexota bacterium]|nr:fluoride efflux transporter CrcB [Chloroflexota bacterium]
MTLASWVAVAVIGGLGALARFVLDSRVATAAGREFPWGTFTVNLSGAFALGLLTALPLDHVAVLLMGAAGIGSYTTFSTWMLESHRLGENGEMVALTVNLVLMMLVGLAAVALGWEVGRAM